jgi:hypothetical protein
VGVNELTPAYADLTENGASPDLPPAYASVPLRIEKLPFLLAAAVEPIGPGTLVCFCSTQHSSISAECSSTSIQKSTHMLEKLLVFL